MKVRGDLVNKNLKRWISGIFLLLLFFPFLQQQFKFFNEKKLSGVSNHEPYPSFSDSTWFSGNFQEDFETATNTNIGFESFFVRLQCQLNYSIFNLSKAKGVIIGKSNVLFGQGYLDAVNGKDFKGREYIDVETDKIKMVQEELKKRNITLFTALAPGKGSYAWDFIPDNLRKNIPENETNYGCYEEYFINKKINFLDLQSYFLKLKHTAKYPLYSISGVHWGYYGCVIAGDTMARYIERLRKIHLPKINIKSVQMIDMAGIYSHDYDVASLMNVFSILPHDVMAYPELSYDTVNTQKPIFLAIGDSYNTGLNQTQIPKNIFTDYHIWLYMDDVYPENSLTRTRIKVKDLNLKKEIERREVICILGTEASLAQYPYGFIDKAFEIYAPHNKLYYALKKKEFWCSVIQTFRNIYKSKGWKEGMIKTANERGVSETQVFLENAIWIFQQDQEKLKVP